nr:MAG TPA: hypothetical protein [Caudoviricetes sp.]
MEEKTVRYFDILINLLYNKYYNFSTIFLFRVSKMS